MTVSVGAKVLCRQTGNVHWIVKRQITDTHWQLIAPGDNGHYIGRLAGQGDLVELKPAPVYQVGAVILRGGVEHTVASDDGDAVTFTVGASRFATRGGEYLHIPSGNAATISKSDLALEQL